MTRERQGTDPDERLRRSEASLAAAQRIARLGSWELDLIQFEDIDDNPLRWSDEVFRIFGFEPGEIEVTNENFFRSVHPDDRALVAEAFRRALSEGTEYSIDHRIVLPDGSIRTVHEQSAIERAPDGRPVRVLGTVQDVTEQRRNAEALRRSEELLRQALSAGRMVGYEVDVARMRMTLTENAAEILGVAGELTQERALEIVHPEDRRRVNDHMQRALTLGDIEDTQFRIIRAETGEPIWVESRAHSVRDPGGRLIALRGVLMDVTERRRSEQEKVFADRMSALGTLAAGVAHEINNPLAAVIANLDLAERLIERGTPERLKAPLRDAREGAGRVRVIVRDLRIFARAEEDHRELVDLHQVLESCLRLAWPEIHPRARLDQQLGPVPPVVGNQARLGQVFLNLLVNAAQAIPEGSAADHRIRVTARTTDSGWAAVEIADTGSGISDTIRNRLFTPFFTTKPVGQGTGLGLSICQRIVSELGGEIRVCSEPGRGSTFTVLLPPAAADC